MTAIEPSDPHRSGHLCCECGDIFAMRCPRCEAARRPLKPILVSADPEPTGAIAGYLAAVGCFLAGFLVGGLVGIWLNL